MLHEQMSLENEMRSLSDNLQRAETVHFDNKMKQDGDEAREEVFKYRHDHEVELLTGQLDKKKEEHATVKAGLVQVEKDFLAMIDYQNALKETNELNERIEAAKVQIQFLSIQVEIAQEVSEQLNNKRDELVEAKKISDDKYE